MSINDRKIKLLFPNQMDEKQKKHYQKLHDYLPTMKGNQLNLTIAEIEITDSEDIKVHAFVRSTVEKPIDLQTTKLFLVNPDSKIIAEKTEDFFNIGTLKPNTSTIYSIEFPIKNLNTFNVNEMKNWTLAFEYNVKHRIDYSDLDESKISESTKNTLNNIVKEVPLHENELSFMGFDAKIDEEKNLHVNLLIRNGTKDNLDIKQLPLKFYDASNKLSAQGTFKMNEVSVLSNTSKPITLVFPSTSILKEELDLSHWSIEHQA